jgi:GcrA cell cycle regulator
MAVWTPERIAEARRLWEEGYSASLIAEKLGEGFTKNSVIGKAHRGKWGQRRPAYARPGTPKGWRAPPSAPKPPHPRLAPSVPIPPQPPPPKPRREPGTLTLLDLLPHECRWPMNAPPRSGEYLFCGRPGFGDGPYCEYHARIGFSGKTARSAASAGWVPRPVEFSG